MTPITVDDGYPFTWAGASSPEELESFAEVCSPSALLHLRDAWYVIAIDLQWGRKERLWEILLEPDRRDLLVAPHPDLKVEHDFYY